MKKILSALIAVLMIAATAISVIPAGSLGFSDVEADRWSAGFISASVEKGYMVGVGDGKFDPDGALTRAAAVTVLWRRHGSPEVSSPSGFEDVEADAWYADAVCWAKDAGVVFGVTDTLFDPNGSVTREQLSTMFFRYSALCPVSVHERADISVFSDAGSVSSYADEAVRWAVQAALIEGTEDGNIDPKGPATREQFAAILGRFDDVFTLEYGEPVLRSSYTEREYPLVTDADFYVSTDGDDGADGTFEHPFATFERAVEAVRGVGKTAEKGGVKVAFMAGDYGPLGVTLTAEDSGTEECPVTYCKYGDGDVTFDNGFSISLDEFEPIGEEDEYLFRENARPKIMKADLSDRLAEGEYDWSYVLVGSDRFYDVARFPNKYDDGTEQLVQNVGDKVDDDTIKITNSRLLRRLEQFHTYDDLRFAGTFAHTWFYGTLDLASYDPETQEASFYGVDKLTYGISDSHVFRFEVVVIGASEELDHEGEYWFDRDTRTLYVYDPHSDLSMATHGTFFDIEKAAYISFVGLDFRNTKGGFAFIDSHDVTLDRCSVIGAADDLFSVPNAGIYNFRLINSEFGILGAGIGRLDDSYPRVNNGDFSSCGIVIDNNYIHDFGMIRTDAALRLFQSIGAVVSHNVFERGGRCAIELWGSSCVTIEYNVFDRMMMNSTDGGSIYDNQDVDRRDIIIRYNLFMNMATTSMGEYAVYIDQEQCGLQIYSNLFFNAGGCATLIAGGRDNEFRDNVVIATEEFKGGVTIMDSSMIEEGENPEDNNYYQKWRATVAYLSNPDSPRTKAYRERWPDIFNVTLDYSDLYDPNCCITPNNTITGNYYFKFNAERGVDTMNNLTDLARAVSTVENNEYYNTSENPLFVNPSIGDYRLIPGVDFPDIHFEQIGRY